MRRPSSRVAAGRVKRSPAKARADIRNSSPVMRDLHCSRCAGNCPAAPRCNATEIRLFYVLNIYFDRIDTPSMTSTAWLARLQHDLVKRLLWPARDRRDLGGAPAPGELARSLDDPST